MCVIITDNSSLVTHACGVEITKPSKIKVPELELKYKGGYGVTET